MKPVTFAALGSLALALTLSAAAPLQAQTAPATVASLEQIFRAEPYRGENAKDAAFSRSGRYLAYLWSPFGEPGTDLWVHDTKTGKTQRITSPQVMAAFESPEDMERFDRKLRQRNTEYAERQAREVAQQAYLRGEKVDLSQWENAQLAVLKKELAEKKAKDEAQKAADKAEAEAEKQAMAALAAKRAGKPVPVAAPASAASSPDKKDDKEKEVWELRDELKKKLARDKLKPSDLYPGPAQFVWAHKADELVFQYRGGLYRWKADDKLPAVTPLVATQRELRLVAYTGDDSGVLYTDETRVLRTSLKQPGVQVVNRELIHGDDEQQKKYKIDQTAISEDGRWMALLAKAPLKTADDKPAPPGRQVEIMNYSERWATAKKVNREVSDDKRSEKPLALYIRQVAAPGEAPRKQAEPVFTNAGGDVWFEMSDVAWARDGSRYAFTTWERDKELLRVYIGATCPRPASTPVAPQGGAAGLGSGPAACADESAKPEMVLERRGEVGHEVVNVIKPRFTPDAKTLVLALDEAGWRQPYAIDVATKALRPLVKGEFEAHQIIGFTADSKALFVLANQGDTAAMNVLRVDMASGATQALGTAGEFHRAAAASEDGRWVAANAGNWAQRPELKLLATDAKTAPRTLTDSTDKAWAQLKLLQPERFNFTNRHGDRIEAYVFKPAGWKAGDKRPAVVYVYGGPLNDRHIVEVDSFQNTAYLFGQYMAAKYGYVTVAVDPRGHSNYGRKFSDANWERAGEPQAEDLEDLAKLLPAQYGVDARRIGLNGWSFGGFQTQYTMYTRPDVFAAGIAGAGPTEWENYNSWYSGRTIGKATDRTKPVLRKYSLLPLAKGLKHPLLLVHGMQDPNVLYQDTVNVYRELLDSGKDALVELYLDPDGVHAMGGVVKPAGWHRKYEAFWLRNLGRATP
ncbi:dipeptidyl aminopeptidase/acylaminoacyl peptidase [Pelomonas saccharophila]|uniref:Dipeptidyl aminopeptidase/acylaminoacyl peptidase n=1 Tax=Roseateles saccharophilus TaxID=304 RepID=A0ABU1YK75_ROSSA|nr:dipeptidyl aminopeptidase/acylaminoacyl peptidase [Roseateles saccharophilus]